VVSVNALSDTHAAIATAALRNGAHVFVEKPLAAKVEAAEEMVALARAQCRPVPVQRSALMCTILYSHVCSIDDILLRSMSVTLSRWLRGTPASA
jgi:hypothetical protein